MTGRREQKTAADPGSAGNALEAMGHLHRLSSLVASDRLDDALTTAVEIPIRCLGFSGTALLVPSEDSDGMRLLAGCGLDEALRDEVASYCDDDIIGWVITNSAPRVVDDISALCPDSSTAYLRHGMRSAVCVPVETGGMRPGVMLCVSQSARASAVWEIELVSMVANQVSSVLRRQDTAEIGFAYARLSEQSRVQARHLRSLYRVARTITSTLDLDLIGDEITNYLCGNLSADACALVLYDEAHDELHLAGAYPKEDSERFLQLVKPVVKSAVRSTRPLEFQEIGSAPEYAGVEAVRRLGLRSGVVTALTVKGSIIGFIAAFRRQPRGFSRDDVKITAGLAELTSIAVENARLYRRQHDIASITKCTLIPTGLPGIPGFDIGYKYSPAEQVGGDYCDIVGLRNGRYGVVVADVAGRDVAAACHMAMCRHSFRATADEIRSPDALIAKMNRLVCQQTECEAFISMLYVIVNPATGKLALCSAGHEPALIYRAETGTVEELTTDGLLLGINTSETFSLRNASICTGDVLTLYTDGLTDGLTTRDCLGVDRLKELLVANCSGSAQRITDVLYDLVQPRPGDRGSHAQRRDDIAMILLKAL